MTVTAWTDDFTADHTGDRYVLNDVQTGTIYAGYPHANSADGLGAPAVEPTESNIAGAFSLSLADPTQAVPPDALSATVGCELWIPEEATALTPLGPGDPPYFASVRAGFAADPTFPLGSAASPNICLSFGQSLGAPFLYLMENGVVIADVIELPGDHVVEVGFAPIAFGLLRVELAVVGDTITCSASLDGTPAGSTIAAQSVVGYFPAMNLEAYPNPPLWGRSFDWAYTFADDPVSSISAGQPTIGVLPR